MLTDTFLRSLKPADKPKKYADGGGLFIYVSTTGSKLWRMAYRFNMKSKLLSFGEYPLVSLKEARDQRDEAKKLLAKDIDPGQHKKELRAARIAEEANTFRAVALEWYETQTTHNTPAHRRRLMFNLEKYLFPSLGRKAITSIEAQDLLAISKPLEVESTWISHRVVQICGKIFRYAIASGKLKHNITADLRGALRPIPTRHHAGLTDPLEVGKLLLDLDNFTGFFQTHCALRLLPLTFVRATELRRAEWKEIDFEDKLWRIPAERMKMRTPHYVPLSEQALAIFRSLHGVTGEGKYIFPGTRGNGNVISPSTMLNALRFMGYRRDVMCIHGFRTMASTLLNELGYNRDWIERQLAHQERNGVRDAYNCAQYLPQRRKMMQEYADYLDTLREKARQAA